MVSNSEISRVELPYAEWKIGGSVCSFWTKSLFLYAYIFLFRELFSFVSGFLRCAFLSHSVRPVEFSFRRRAENTNDLVKILLLSVTKLGRCDFSGCCRGVCSFWLFLDIGWTEGSWLSPNVPGPNVDPQLTSSVRLPAHG